MDQSLAQFRAAVQKALQTGDSGAVATEETQKRLARSRGWVSAQSLKSSLIPAGRLAPLSAPTKRK